MICNPRIVVRKNGSAVLTGLSYQDLCHLLTLASIQHYASEERNIKSAKEAGVRAEEYRAEGNTMMAEIVMKNSQDDTVLIRRIRAILNMLKARTSPSYTGDDGPIHTLSDFQVARRLDNVRRKRTLHRRISEYFNKSR